MSGGPARPGAGVRIEPAEGRSAFRDFLHLPGRLHGDDPDFVAPLLHDVRKMFDPRAHPFHEHAEVRPFVAYADGRPAGRIAAIHNRNHTAFHDDRTGFFGFFACEDDPAVAAALFDAAGAWLRERGLDTMRGPASFSTNEEVGLLVEGFGRPPAVMMPWNPPWYVDLVEGAGFSKAKDLLAFTLDSNVPPDRLVQMERRLSERLGVTIRPLRMRDFEAELERVRELYNRCWERNWGFVPMTDAEISHMAKELKRLLARVPEQVLFAERGGAPVGFTLWLLDYNRALRHARGRLFPLGLLKILWHLRGIDFARVLTLGVLPEERGQGIDSLLIMAIFRHGRARGVEAGEFSWVLEDNLPMLKPLERIGARAYKRYRVYDRPL